MNKNAHVLDRISIDMERCGARPCIRGTRIRVSDILELYAAGLSAEQILEEMPDLVEADLRAALLYAARKLNHSLLSSSGKYPMEAIIFVGLQASGKSSFYKERFFNTHVRINLDMLRTRHREHLLLQFCLQMGQRFVVDNTNPTKEDRVRYIAPAKAAGFRVVGCYFQSNVRDCVTRNNAREGAGRIPAVGIYSTAKKLQLPSFSEGFDALYYVRIDGSGGLTVEEWIEQASTEPGN